MQGRSTARVGSRHPCDSVHGCVWLIRHSHHKQKASSDFFINNMVNILSRVVVLAVMPTLGPQMVLQSIILGLQNKLA